MITLLAALFFASGFSALIYQVLWTRFVTSMMGGSDYSIAIIVTIFMAGLGIGSKIAGSLSRRLQNPRTSLIVFSSLEAVTAIYALALPHLAPLTKPLLAWFYASSMQSPHIYHAGAFIVCVLVIIPPVMLMGATLPVLCSAIASNLNSSRTRVPVLYGVNTLGAAVGALAAGFFLIYVIGVRATNYLAAGIDLGVALICFLMARKVGSSENPSQPIISSSQANKTSLDAVYLRRSGSAALIITFVSGFTALAAEVIWSKLFGLLAGPTTFSFSVVLFCYILCLGVGSLLAVIFIRKLRDVLPVLIIIQVLISLAIVVVSHYIGNSSLFFAKITHDFQHQPGLLEFAKLLAVLLLIGLPVTLIGISFPLAFRVCALASGHIGESIGNVYAINTIGSVLGSGLAGFVLIPWLGMQASLSLISFLQLIVALLLALFFFKLSRTMKSAVFLVAIVGVFITQSYPAWNRAHLAEGKYHRFNELGLSLSTISYGQAFWRGPEIIAAQTGEPLLLYYGEGIGGFTTVMEEVDVLGNRRVYMANSGKVDASSHGDIYTQALLAHLPVMAKPDATNALSIGFGCGMTSGEFLHYPDIFVDSVEISPQVIAAASHFNEWNNGVLDSPRNRTIIQDARAHLTLGHVSYDIITAEPSNPWMAGLANLFTVEYLSQVKNRLNDDGVFIQFLHSYQMDWETFSLMVRTINAVFPNAIMFRPAFFGSDYALLCFKNPNGSLEYDSIAEALKFTRLSKVIRITEPEVVYPLIVTEDISALVGPGPLHTDDMPLLELRAPRSMHHDGAAVDARIESQRILHPETEVIMEKFTDTRYQLAFARYLASGNQPPYLTMASSSAESDPEEWHEFLEEIKHFAEQNPTPDYKSVPPDLIRYVADIQEPLMLKQRIRLLAEDDSDKRQLSAIHATLVSLYSATGRAGELSHALLHLIMLNPDDWALKASLASLYYQQGAYASALELLTAASDPPSELVLLRAQCMAMLGMKEEGRMLILKHESQSSDLNLRSSFENYVNQL